MRGWELEAGRCKRKSYLLPGVAGASKEGLTGCQSHVTDSRRAAPGQGRPREARPECRLALAGCDLKPAPRRPKFLVTDL